MTVPLRYSNNANIKYPLSDFHETDVPNDILLNLSMTVPDGVEPVASIIQVTPFTAFLAIEDALTNALLGSVLVEEPVPTRVYPIDMDVDGFGYVVFGPGIRTPYNSGNVSIALDPDTVVYSPLIAPELQLEVNGVNRGVRSVLNIEESTNILLFTVEGNTIYIDRNDDLLTAEQISGFTSLAGSIVDGTEIVATIAGAEPDDAGNINILFRDEDYYEDCPDVYTMEPVRTLDGTYPGDALPLDILVSRQDVDEDYECVDPDDPGPEDPDIGPQNIKTAIILDLFDDKRVGVLYSKRGDEIVEGGVIGGGLAGAEDDDYTSVLNGLAPDSVDGDYVSIIDAQQP